MREIRSLEGALIAGRFQLEAIADASANGRRWMRARDLASGRAVVVRSAAAAASSDAAIPSERARLLARYRVLLDDTSALLPSAITLLRAPSVFSAGRDDVVSVEELVEGASLAELMASPLPIAARLQLAREVGRQRVLLWKALRARGHVHTRVDAQRTLIERGTERVRLLDAEGVVEVSEQVMIRHFTPAWLTPNLYAAAQQGALVTADIGVLLPQLGKLLHALLTGVAPMAGALPDMSALSGFPDGVVQAIREQLWLDERAPVWAREGPSVEAIEAFFDVRVELSTSDR